jgi:hypothetical protein
VASSSYHGNEPVRSINGKELLDQLNLLLASQEELCSIESVVLYFPSS